MKNKKFIKAIAKYIIIIVLEIIALAFLMHHYIGFLELDYRSGRRIVLDLQEKKGEMVVLLYHDLKPEIKEGDNTNSTTTIMKFEQDVVTLVEHGYQSLSLENYYQKKYDPTKDYFVLTFDDGYISNYQDVFPILKKYQMYADIFINTNSVDLKNHFNMKQAQEMERSGLVKIYSHFTEHMAVENMPIEDFKKYLLESYSFLEENLSAPRLRMFAFPHGRYNEATYEAAKSLGTVLQFVQEDKLGEEDIRVRVPIEYETDIQELCKEKTVD